MGSLAIAQRLEIDHAIFFIEAGDDKNGM